MNKTPYLLLLPLLFVCTLKAPAQPAADSGWMITATSSDHYHPVTLANGMIGVVPAARPFQFERVVLNGVYDRYGSWGDGIANIVQGIDFLNLDVRVDSGGWISQAAPGKLKDWRQVMDMRRACLKTSFIYADSLAVTYTVYALRQLPYNALMTVEIRALHDVNLTIINTFKGAESATLTITNLEKMGRIPLASALASSPTGKVQLAVATTFLFNQNGPTAIYALKDPAANRRSFEKKLAAGDTFSFALSGAICTSAAFPDPKNEAKRLALAAHLQGVPELIARHEAEWAKLWQSDIQLEGDIPTQRDIRFALYNLYSFVREGSGLSLSPMGLSSTGYNGHAFWDTEVWMFPVLLALHPEIARSLLDYRVNRLGAARQNALVNGYRGAMFPWESAGEGTEETPVWALTGPFEQHITADIGIACWNYYRVTGDRDWLKEKGFPVLKEVADFWVSRVSRNAKGEDDINNVVCADEYAENVDNNAFTNGAAKVVLQDAVKAAGILQVKAGEGWAAVAAHIPIRYFPDSVIREYDGYDGRMIKQADANLLSYPLNLVSREVSRRSLDYYASRVDPRDGPAMTYGIFSVISSRLGDTAQAYRYFRQAYVPNQRPPFGGLAETPASEDPYFATGAGAMLQAVIYGFAGLDLTDKGITQLKTRLPASWKKLTITGVGPEKKTYVVY